MLQKKNPVLICALDFVRSMVFQTASVKENSFSWCSEIPLEGVQIMPF